MGTGVDREGITEMAACLLATRQAGMTTTELCTLLCRECFDFAMVTPA
jgi:hypothetical protein